MNKVLSNDDPNQHLQVNYPINLYLLLPFSIGPLILLFPAPFIKILFYGILFFFFFYILFSRQACRMEIENNLLKINYFFFWDKNVIVDLNDIVSADYGKSFYDLVSDKRLGDIFAFPKYCYDELVLEMKDGKEIYLHTNTRMFGFNKVYEYISRFLKEYRS